MRQGKKTMETNLVRLRRKEEEETLSCLDQLMSATAQACLSFSPTVRFYPVNLAVLSANKLAKERKEARESENKHEREGARRRGERKTESVSERGGGGETGRRNKTKRERKRHREREIERER
jgi:hypothetical protein